MKIAADSFMARLQGHLGKNYVVKHYKKMIVVTKYPDMTGIIPTDLQLKQRNYFKEAVAYAKKVIADPERNAAWEQKLLAGKRVFTEAVKKYMILAKFPIQDQNTVSDHTLKKITGNMPVKELKYLRSLAKAA